MVFAYDLLSTHPRFLTVHAPLISLLTNSGVSTSSGDSSNFKAAIVGGLALVLAAALPLLRGPKHRSGDGDKREMTRLRRVDTDYHKMLISQIGELAAEKETEIEEKRALVTELGAANLRIRRLEQQLRVAKLEPVE